VVAPVAVKPGPMRVAVAPRAEASAAPDTRSIMVAQDNQEFGPYTREEVRRYLADGSIAAEAFFWREGMPEWRPVNEL